MLLYKKLTGLLQLAEQLNLGSGDSDGTDSQSREDADLAAALAASLVDSSPGGASGEASVSRISPPDGEESELEKALQMSLTEHLSTVPNPDPKSQGT